MKLNRKYSLTIIPTLTDEVLVNLQRENEKYFVFVDLGSGSIESISKILHQKQIFVLDHHIVNSQKYYPDYESIDYDIFKNNSETNTIKNNNSNNNASSNVDVGNNFKFIYENVIHLNPHLYNIDGSIEISGAGVVFFFTQYLTGNNNNEMSRIAIVGAIGDVQENNGFKKLNNEILEIALKNDLIEVRKGLKFFGIQTKPVHKILQYSSDILIPGVSGSETGAINFLLSLGINPKLKNEWKKLSDFTEDEKKRLVAGIIMKMNGKADILDIVSNIYLLKGEKEDSPFRDAKEFSTLLNSCGRLDKASIGIGACLNDPKMKQLSEKNLNDYRKEIVNALNWYKENQGSDRIIKSKNAIIINAGDDIVPTMIGTLGSIISKSVDIEKNIFILSLARNYDNTTKVSLRISGNPNNINLKEIIELIIEKINHGSSGGHTFAAGAVISTDKEDIFINAALEVLNNLVLEEQLS